MRVCWSSILFLLCFRLQVIYRPPSGNENTFHEEFDDLLRELPSENVHISGDYNIDLLSRGSDEFEQSIYEKNLIPTISIATHEKPGCKASLIDNILTNSTGKLLLSGVLKSRVSHHFQIIMSMTLMVLFHFFKRKLMTHFSLMKIYTPIQKGIGFLIRGSQMEL